MAGQHIYKSRETSLCSGIGGAIRNFGRQLQSALPIVGLLSRLAASSGGIGNDEIVGIRPSSD